MHQDARHRHLWGLGLVGVALAVAWLLLLRPQEGRPAATTVLPGIRLGQPAPDFTLPRLGGGSFHLAALRGRPVLLNFWSVSCDPCRQEMPALNRASRELAAAYGTRAPAIVGMDDPLDSVGDSAGFARRYHISYPLLVDTQYAVAFTQYHVGAIPASVFVDRAGRVAAVHLGPLDYAAIMRQMRALV
jgi:cytochrome c biogenesis protein CcmG/thiol:disulfide interchange protein DsbE